MTLYGLKWMKRIHVINLAILLRIIADPKQFGTKALLLRMNKPRVFELF